MTAPSRRTWLRSISTGLTVALAGCSAFGGDESPPGGTAATDETRTVEPTATLTPTTTPDRTTSAAATNTPTTTETVTGATDTPIASETATDATDTGTPTETPAARTATGALTPTEGDGRPDKFGRSVAADGDTALVGAPDDDGGSVAVFQRGDGWELETVLRPERAEVFGRPVAVDGETAVVGDRFASRDGRYGGRAYIYERTGGEWERERTVTAPDGRGDDQQFDGVGWSAAVAGDTVLVGAQRPPTPQVNHTGSVQVLERSDGAWTRVESLTPEAATFGWTVALPTAGRALVGAPLDQDDRDRSGSAWAFERDGDAWHSRGRLRGDGGGEFGDALDADGDTAVVSARGDEGDVVVLGRADGDWERQTRLPSPDRTQRPAVAVADGTVVVGARADAADGPGTAHAYERDGDRWRLRARLVTGEETSATYGAVVAASSTITLVAAPGDSEYGDRRGAVYAFDP